MTMPKKDKYTPVKTSPYEIPPNLIEILKEHSTAVSYTHLTLPTTLHECRSRWSPYH